MSPVFDGLNVLDLSWGVAGPMTGMLLADHGARVTKIEPPGGDPFRFQTGYRVWNRGKRSAVLDLAQEADRARLRVLAGRADVLIESFAPGAMQRLGIDADTLRAANPRLVYCSITGYGRDTRHADRPGYDALVAARIGMQWEQRGWPGGIHHICRREDPLAELDVPESCLEGAPREGPVFSSSRWPSLGACYLATLAISAALRAREVTGRGQWVETSLLQGALAAGVMGWQRVEHPEATNFAGWLYDRRAPKGIYRCADGRWVSYGVPSARFVRSCVRAGRLSAEAACAPRQDPDRLGMDHWELAIVVQNHAEIESTLRGFAAEEWVKIAAEVGVPLQHVRSTTDALHDPAFLADGCVARLDDPEQGPIHMLGITHHLARSPGRIAGPAPRVGQHSDEVRAEASKPAAGSSLADGPSLSAPLAGIRVLDLGLAIAGPFGTKMLADLGADVVKVNAFHDEAMNSHHMVMPTARGKRSIAIDLKQARGLAVLQRLVETADVVHYNMRTDAARRLGLDAATLRRINPRIITCQVRGYEKGPRADLPGNDMVGAALTGVMWEDGGCDDGGKPFWSLTPMGDTGAALLSAIAVVQALYHRERTGEGQEVDTSIVNAGLLNTSYTWAHADGSEPPRARLDAGQLGLSALYRLYATADGWLCLAALRDSHWPRLCVAIGHGDLVADRRFASRAARVRNDRELAGVLAGVFAAKPASEWLRRLDEREVPCEISSPAFGPGIFDDPELRERGWVVAYPHPQVGLLEQHGLLFDFSETPGRIAGPPPMVGQHTREILAESGYTDAEVDALCADGIARQWYA